MNSTAYKGINNLVKGLTISGGLCQFWFIPIEEVAYIPAIDSVTQTLTAEPVLKSGMFWRGPVPVPERQLGIKETVKTGKSGPSYQIKIGCIYAGDIPATRTNLDNMAYPKYLVVGKMRGSGAYVLMGSLEAGCDFIADFDSGTAIGNAAITKLEFSIEQMTRALVMHSFDGTESGYIDFTGETITPQNDFWILE